MQLSNVKSVIIGVSAAAAAIAITGAASGSGVGAIFNLGKTNTVNATSSLTGSTKHPMLSVTNKGAGTALSLQVAKGKAPFSVNSSVQISKLNASLLGGLAASSFVQGGGQSRAFGFPMSTSSVAPAKLLSVPGFGTLIAICIPDNGGTAEVRFAAGSHTMDAFITAIASNSSVSAQSAVLTPPKTTWVLTAASATVGSVVSDRLILRYATGSMGSLTTHIAALDIMASVFGPKCDFDATASIGPGVKGP
jgi:hypothetical protein